MARYIDIDTAIKTAIETCVKVVGHGITQIDAVDIADAFENIPSADVVPNHKGGLTLTIDGAEGYFPKEFIIAAIKTHMKQSEDTVEVIRCRNCEYWDKDNIEKHTYSSNDSTPADFAECTYWSNWSKCHLTRYNDYCSLAEERTE